MKKRLLVILITSLVMIGAMGGFLWKMNSISKGINKQRNEFMEQEMDTDKSQKAYKDVEPLELQELYLSGSNKNVITKDYDGPEEVYNVKNSAEAEELLTDIKKKGDYTTEKPLWAYNPYGTNNNALYLYFQSHGKCYVRYTVSVKDTDIPDFTRTLTNNKSGNLTEEHEYQIIGLVPGKTNYIILKMYNSKNELARTLYFKVKMPKSSVGAQTILKSDTGRSKETIQSGLYTVFQDPVVTKKTETRTVTKKVKKKGKTKTKKVNKKVTVTEKKSAVLLYDNSGVLRAEFPVLEAGTNAEMIYDNLVYAYSSNGIAQVNSLGQVVDCLNMPSSYYQYGEFAYDGYGSLYVLADYKKDKAPGGHVVKIEMSSGEVTDALSMAEVLPAVLKKEGKGKKVRKNWLNLDSIQVVGTNQLLLGSSKLSSIFKVSNVNSLMPKLDYIVGDKDLWKTYKKLKKKVLEKTLPEGATEPPVETPIVDSILETKQVTPDVFTSQYGQNAMVLSRDSSLAEGQYYLEMLNNNAGRGASKGNKNSYYYKYLIDENAGTYILEEKDRLEKNSSGGNVTPYDTTYLYCDSDSKRFLECDQQGKLIKSFSVRQKVNRVYKSDWKGFWFY